MHALSEETLIRFSFHYSVLDQQTIGQNILGFLASSFGFLVLTNVTKSQFIRETDEASQQTIRL
jgi:hypothetical protein